MESCIRAGWAGPNGYFAYHGEKELEAVIDVTYVKCV